MTLAVGSKGIDFAYNPTGHADIDAEYSQMVHDGAHFFCRYSAGTLVSAKVTRRGEPAAAAKYGADFFANFEGAESTPLQGATAGAQCGTKDKDFWDEVGLAPGAGVIVSLEPGNDSSDWPALSAFLEAYHAKTARPLGLYAGLQTLIEMRRRGLIVCTWLPMASSASRIDTSGMDQPHYAAKLEQVARDNGITLCQNRNRWYREPNGGYGADEDVYITALSHPFTHLQALAAASHPAPTPAPATYRAHPWPWPDADSSNMLGDFANPSLDVHGGTHQWDPSPQGDGVRNCIVDVHRAFVKIVGSYHLDDGYWGLWGSSTDEVWLRVRAQLNLAPLDRKTMDRADYGTVMRHVGFS